MRFDALSACFYEGSAANGSISRIVKEPARKAGEGAHQTLWLLRSLGRRLGEGKAPVGAFWWAPLGMPWGLGGVWGLRVPREAGCAVASVSLRNLERLACLRNIQRSRAHDHVDLHDERRSPITWYGSRKTLGKIPWPLLIIPSASMKYALFF